MNIEDEIADEISGIQVGSGYYSTTIGIDAAQEAAAALMPLVRRAQAEAWERGHRHCFHVENPNNPIKGNPYIEQEVERD